RCWGTPDGHNDIQRPIPNPRHLPGAMLPVCGRPRRRADPVRRRHRAVGHSLPPLLWSRTPRLPAGEHRRGLRVARLQQRRQAGPIRGQRSSVGEGNAPVSAEEGDGCVDLFIGRYVKFDPTYRSYYAADNFPGPLDYEGDTNLLFHNTCKGSFTDVSEASGIAGLTGRAMGVTAADFDGDGYPDIYVANDKTENFLLHNKRNGTFEEIALDAGAAFGQNGESTSAMGPVFFDMDNDGTMDLWVSDSKYNRLLKNSRILPFKDVTQQAGISQQTAQYTSWGTGAYDFDNDGWKDLFIAHGGLINMVPQEDSLFRNLGGGKFQDVSTTGGPFFDTKSVGRGACFADYDNDGKMDAFLVNLGGPGV